MGEHIDLKDLSFIEDLAPEMAEMIYDICLLNIQDMISAIKHPDNVDDKFLKQLSKDKLEEMFVFYKSMLDVFVEKERYEDCGNVKLIVETLEKHLK
jgi:hypothetical protein